MTQKSQSPTLEPDKEIVTKEDWEEAKDKLLGEDNQQSKEDKNEKA